MKKDKLLYIYNPIQAEFIIREAKGDGLYRIGKGGKGDICVSFYKTEKVKQAMDKWCSNNK